MMMIQKRVKSPQLESSESSHLNSSNKTRCVAVQKLQINQINPPPWRRAGQHVRPTARCRRRQRRRPSRGSDVRRSVPPRLGSTGIMSTPRRRRPYSRPPAQLVPGAAAAEAALAMPPPPPAASWRVPPPPSDGRWTRPLRRRAASPAAVPSSRPSKRPGASVRPSPPSSACWPTCASWGRRAS